MGAPLAGTLPTPPGVPEFAPTTGGTLGTGPIEKEPIPLGPMSGARPNIDGVGGNRGGGPLIPEGGNPGGGP